MSFSRAVSRLEHLAFTFARSNYTRHVQSWQVRSLLRFQVPPKRSLVTSGSPATSDVKILSDALNLAAARGNIPEIHKRYGPLSRALKGTAPKEAVLDQSQVSSILVALASSGRPFDLELIETILADMRPLFGVVIAPIIHTRIIRGLIKRGNSQTVLHWLMSMPRKPGNIIPTIRHWHMYLHHLSDTRQLASLRRAVSQMPKSGRKPSTETFILVFEALFKSAAHLREFREILDLMTDMCLPYEPSIDAVIYDGFVKQNLHQHASQFRHEYRTRSDFYTKGKGLPPPVDWNSALEKEAEGRGGVQSAVALCKTFAEEGYTVIPHTLTVILRRSDNVDELRYAESRLNLKATALQWALLINNAVRKGDIPKAMAIYRDFQTTGIPPDAPLVHPLIRALCGSTFKEQNDAAIDDALELYRDLALAQPVTPAADGVDVPSAFSVPPRHSTGPDTSLYDTILRALGTSADPSKYLPIARSLLEDMKARNILLEGSMAIASVVIILMRCASSYDDALQSYKKMCRGEGSFQPDDKGYQAILHTLCQLSFPGETALPSVWHYFEIVKDMRAIGHEITSPVYTILLRRLAQLAADLPDEWRATLAGSVRRVHDFLTLDPYITPDTALWNQLMDTYQRVGLFAEAYRIWEMMFISGTFNHASVSVILDACGYARAWPTAMQVCLKLKRIGFRFNQRTWNTWVECMCRMGKLNDAVKAVCLEMGQDQTDVAPDLDTIKILMGFAGHTNQQDEVISRIKRYLPELWQTLPDGLRGR
ncbi:hypothetical protein BV22DRAFT_1054975 [Leucogyrophana mollusca]|uniref:Uncharacterized protein n=1 Tax=Leucogyrophana mollusca TaxID=85980 RepID=A0ACB8BXN4_9AGAM|nr:hypothetical protein BV22DRAFT_1054975 [Leucogyrophana mollusca]